MPPMSLLYDKPSIMSVDCRVHTARHPRQLAGYGPRQRRHCRIYFARPCAEVAQSKLAEAHVLLRCWSHLESPCRSGLSGHCKQSMYHGLVARYTHACTDCCYGSSTHVRMRRCRKSCEVVVLDHDTIYKLHRGCWHRT
jgi:hypothetical protein